MKRSRSPRDLRASALPIAGGVLLLLIASRFAWLAPPLSAGVRGLLFLLLLGAAAGACHHPLGRGGTLGLGALALPAAVRLGGAVPAAALAGAALLLAELAHRGVRLSWFQVPERRRPLRAFESAGRAALATLAAGLAWTLVAVYRPAAGALLQYGTAAAVYLAAWFGLEAADRKLRRPDQPVPVLPLLRPLGLDLAGWAAGAFLALAGLRAGWGVAAALAAALALLALEAARNGLLLEAAGQRIEDLERVGRAGQRMAVAGQEMAGVAERIRVECGRVLDFHWFQLELLAPGSPYQSWWSRSGGAVFTGAPEPEGRPPALPGVHRRSTWQILERQLRTERGVVARLRVWCDPRRLDPEEVALLDRLLPQMAASVERSLLDREAREDPLTGVAVRRVLERRLQEVHSRCLDQGGTMAVVLCDLDHFKRINDTHGHGAGDQALVAVAGVLQSHRREGDLCCRYGGEEFTLLLDEADGETALAVAERLRAKVEALALSVEGRPMPLTLSAGIACFPELMVKAPSELLLFADEALYEAKRRGRNQCLLNLGQGRYASPGGDVHRSETAPPIPEPPRIFA